MAMRYCNGANTDEEKIADIVTSQSKIDDVLSRYILDYLFPGSVTYELFKKKVFISDNILKKLDFCKKLEIAMKIYPGENDKNSVYKRLSKNKFRDTLQKMAKIRNAIGHSSKFILDDKAYRIDSFLDFDIDSHEDFDESASLKDYGDMPINTLYDEYEKLFEEVRDFILVFDSDMDNKEEYLYDQNV